MHKSENQVISQGYIIYSYRKIILKKKIANLNILVYWEFYWIFSSKTFKQVNSNF